ncbi:MAG: DNA-directed RNA polymerase subunit beta' [Spirochaetes bacterium GWD1_61_31]|nr:MAG: DNA-directed RNA polymerase subunit beta' [Spirochaetes bacterium GWB1_60_80]OHD39471.1 MAG: DNA-directed RNA polymerase subunit beta' [Spirochaetes bacterium GWD1_61_31]OHD45523.1 MAG: DNA-directed RNA polymerase subunit beta' [Spirochaetes bacterium GWE1_60_18]OHD58096.1 MAG: DNA-directed RNA polymerase subunit beta' [Spirochaetes bacterium GWF1_60_12]HAP44667.1 DNA-directed RNA polymerase subunit beta' [Spirochaetaceae bacterium]
MRDIQDFDSIMIRLASPELIRSWSYGEVKKPETINYRTLRPEKDGLFCERIFGTTKEWECFCGKFKSIRYKGVICDRCGVEVTHFKVRRERMGHIELASPVSHIWFYRSVPSRMGLLLDLPVAALRSVLYYEKFIVIDAGDTDLKAMQLLSEEEYNEAQDRFGGAFSAGMGAESIRQLLEGLNLDDLAAELRARMIEKGAKSDKRLLKRIEIVESFRGSGNRPEWMILDAIPVIPPELRPMVQLDGGRFATSDLNDLYRRVINRNNRLRRLQGLNAPDIIIRNEKRMLQEAVDALFDNSKKKRVVKGASNRPLKSLSDMLKGKQGRFRQNLLGKRVDYSGRSVIVVGPELKLHQCGLPTKMALELFKPFIMKKLVEKDVVYNIKKAKMLVEQETQEVFAVLDEVVREHPIMLNRAPTLHRLGIQAFEPVLVEGKAIKLHPLVCKAFNADFDGDQMAVHVPLTSAAQSECWSLMLSSRNLLDPANGKTIVYPSQDMVLGIYYLMRDKPGAKGEGKRYSCPEEAYMACESGFCDWEAMIKVPAPKRPVWKSLGVEDPAANEGKPIITTAARLLFNEAMPPQVAYINYSMTEKDIRMLIEWVHRIEGSYITVVMLDAIKDMGFKYATFFGATIGMDDIIIPKEKYTMIDAANLKVAGIQEQYLAGHITQEERYNQVVEVWSKTNEDVTAVMMKTLEASKNGFNNIHMMAHSGARGSKNQIRQLAGMRGLMAKPGGDIIELPIRSNFKEGLSVIEFFISTNGARKGLADTALKTADAGYLTRRLVDIAQDVVVNIDDCGTINGILNTAIKDGEEIIETLRERIIGRYTLERIRHPITDETIVDVNQEITEEVAEAIEQAGVESVTIRTVQTCEARHGVCRKCYGRNLATGRTVDIGEAVGIIAAQSIGQPGTQLTMRTFHIGGAATKASEENRIAFKYPVLVQAIEGLHVTLPNGRLLFTRKGYITVSKVFGEWNLEAGDKPLIEDGRRILKGDQLIKRKNGTFVIATDISYARVAGKKFLSIAQELRSEVRNGSEMYAVVGDVVAAGTALAMFDPFADPIISEHDGYVRYEDIIEGSTLKNEINEDTGNVEKKITDSTGERETKQPRLVITDEAGNEIITYLLPGGAYLNVDDGEAIKAGKIVAKTLKEGARALDIVGGLPRVGELFEARKPKTPTVLAMVAGKVAFRGIVKGKRVIVVVDIFNREFKHLVPVGRRLLVRDGDSVEAGDKLCDGNPSPHEIMAISGEHACQRFIMDEIQQVYRIQGVTINDKHIGVIVRQMMKKVEIVIPGDTRFIYGQHIDKYRFHEENRRVTAEGGQPSVARPLLIGITRAALKIDSFISAASFQETTKVLTDAAIAGAVDTLHGLKENVAIGHLIPAGTGMRQYKMVKLSDNEHEDIDTYVTEVIEQRKRERELAAIPDGFDQNGYPYQDEVEFEEDTAFENDEGFSPVTEEEE